MNTPNGSSNYFKNIQIGAGFYLNGNWCIKRSTRTADLYRDFNQSELFGRFYVGQGEVCKRRKD